MLTVNQPLLGERMLRASGFSYRNDGDLDNRWLAEKYRRRGHVGGAWRCGRWPGTFDAP